MIVNGLFKSVNDKEMKLYRIAVVDDEEDDLKHVCHHISDFFSSTDIELNTYVNALQFPIYIYILMSYFLISICLMFQD